MSTTRCDNCGENFFHHEGVPIVFDPIYERLAIQCPRCDKLKDIHIEDDGYVREDI